MRTEWMEMNERKRKEWRREEEAGSGQKMMKMIEWWDKKEMRRMNDYW